MLVMNHFICAIMHSLESKANFIKGFEGPGSCKSIRNAMSVKDCNVGKGKIEGYIKVETWNL